MTARLPAPPGPQRCPRRPNQTLTTLVQRQLGSNKKIVIRLKKLFVNVEFYRILMLTAAPEIQHKGSCTSASDLYSLGMVFIACFNAGHSVVQASHSTAQYFKLAGQVGPTEKMPV